MIGPRRTFPRALVPPHSPGLTMAGAAMLWVGWFGFNGGSALAANSSAATAILATHLAAAVAALVWITIEWVRTGKPTSIGMVTGCVAGLACVTPASGYISPMGALVLGAVSGTVCFFAVNWVKGRLKIDDSLDVFAVHGVGGMLGSILVAILAAKEFGGVGYAEDLDMGSQLAVQALAVAVTALWSAIATIVLVKVLAAVTGLRVSPEAETEGLDIVSHGESAYENT
jgi:Amt family ammonium transporter